VIDAFALRLAALGGWAKLVVALLAGALTIFAFPSFSVVPALWVAFPVLFWLLDGCRTWKAAFFVGWAFGAGYFATGLYWMANAFYVDADAFGAFAIPAVGSLAIAMALFIAIVCALTHIVPPADVEEMSYERASVTARRILLFAAVWTFVEWIRSWIFTGLPWNPLGLVWSETRTPVGLPVLQVAALIGTYGLSFLTVLFAAAPAVLGYTPRLRWAWLTAGAPLAVMLIVGAGGALRLAIAPDDLVPGVKFRLVQANVSQADRSRPSLWVRHLEDYVRLSNEARPADVTHVVWGEAAIAFFLNIDEPARRVAAMAAPANGMLITGADRGVRGETGQAVYNSLYVVRPDASIAAVYDKTHLVPFGEYTPLRDLVPFDEITGMSGGFAAGTGLATLEVAGLPPFTPLICYEVIFSGDVTPGGQPAPGSRSEYWDLGGHRRIRAGSGRFTARDARCSRCFSTSACKYRYPLRVIGKFHFTSARNLRRCLCVVLQSWRYGGASTALSPIAGQADSYAHPARVPLGQLVPRVVLAYDPLNGR
jgi:apolipoprotein N-acyltransferase